MRAMETPLRRSLLYVPAFSEAMVRKAGARGADVLILDLEDGVHPDTKEAAREQAAALRPTVDFGGSEVWLRVNTPGTPWHGNDLGAVARIAPEAVVLPKCEDPRAVAAVASRIAPIPLYPMIETARGVLAAAEIARLEGTAGLVFGAADFRESVRAARDPEEGEVLFARSTIVVAARAAGKEVFDTPFFDYRDEAGLERSARRARNLGFDGKTAVHPGQVLPINAAFAPTAAEVERARLILDAIEEAARAGRAVATVGGEMVEALHIAESRRTLARARQAGLVA
jgi:citrate lyase subunit beta/citryl-CoA lyase